MSKHDFVDAGKHPNDPARPEIDVMLFAIERLKTHLVWTAEYLHEFEELKDRAGPEAQQKIKSLGESIVEAKIHLRRLAQLVLMGCSVDPTKKVPGNLFWQSWPSDDYPVG